MIHTKAGDWKKCEKLCREAVLIAQSMDAVFKSGFEMLPELKAKLNQAYDAAPMTDEHFANSLVSAARITFYLKAYFRKLGFDCFKDIIAAPHLIKTFGTEVSDSCKWLMKFKDYVDVPVDDKKTN